MTRIIESQRTIFKLSGDDYITDVIEAFLIDRKIQNKKPGPLSFYREKLAKFLTFCEGQQISTIFQVDASSIRKFLLWLEDTGHNPGGIHGFYRSIKALLKWYESEIEPDGWHNPIKKIKSPKVDIEPLEPLPVETIKALLNNCENSIYGLRDKAIIFMLFDTGLRASEILSLNISDINYLTGEILLRSGKGGKPRYVYLGKAARKVLRNYLKRRTEKSVILWLCRGGERLSYAGLRSILRRCSERAGIDLPSIHSFRRSFAINMLRNGASIYALKEIMGHTDLQVLQRYLKLNNSDLKEAHNKASPGDAL